MVQRCAPYDATSVSVRCVAWTAVNAASRAWRSASSSVGVSSSCAAVSGTPANDTWETLGVNSKTQLAQLERLLQQRKANQLLEQGVTLADPSRIDVRGEITCGRDVSIDIGCIFEGNVALADNARAIAGLTQTPVCAVVKADGYGHGAPAVARALEAARAVASFAVSLVEEGVQLRDAGVRARAAASAALSLSLRSPADADDVVE